MCQREEKRERKGKGRQGLLPGPVQSGQSANDGQAPPGTLQLGCQGLWERKVKCE